MGQDHAPQEVYHRVHQPAAERQGQCRTFEAQGSAQLHHEHLRGAHGILFLRQQAGGITCTCREIKTAGIVLKLSRTRVSI